MDPHTGRNTKIHITSSIRGSLDIMKSRPNDVEGTSPVACETTLQNPININSGGEQVDTCTEDDEHENVQNQLVLYDPYVNGEPVTDQPLPPTLRKVLFPNHSSYAQRVLPSVGAFTVQCANCFKWRLIPTKEKYEEIREHILEDPFFCETAREWRPDISCDDPPDLTQDDSRLWAIDKPNISQPPPGWERLLRIRGEGGYKFADVYYVAPSGKRLRSMVEIQRYLDEHPVYVAEGVKMSQFSFLIPKPLQKDYLKKRTHHSTPSIEDTTPQIAGLLESSEVKPITWVGSDEEDTDLRLGGPLLSNAPDISEPLGLSSSSMKKKKNKRKMPSEFTPVGFDY
ncbi:unnamed protein product [Cuscuta epithymum]|uniref:Uncharacterized protein n=1 Tax=Cuscuta epithymum TaxID=186058 RepID=A0AAV0CEX6_9ASTE|nr:unnamed protein product [Cuscuta epithymum]CAH9128426.1 unnamed protein product [Cuscuta epithymum]